MAQEKEPSKRLPWWKRLWGWTEFGKKSGWNWLELLSALAIPVVLTVAGFWFAAQQEEREAKRAELERELAEQRAQDEALQAYLDQMSTLLLEKNLRNSEEDSEVRTLARARTLTVLARLDPSRKTAVMQFLGEAELVHSVEERGPIIRLNGTDLSGANLSLAYLRGATLIGANLRDTNLSCGTARYGIHRCADLSGADLSYANMSGANLSDANLTNANVTQEQLDEADSLQGATIPNGQKYEDWLKSKGRGEDGENGGPS